MWLSRSKRRRRQQAEAEGIKQELDQHRALLGAIASLAHELTASRLRQGASDPETQRRENRTFWTLVATCGVALLALAASVSVAVMQHFDTMRVLRTTE